MYTGSAVPSEGRVILLSKSKKTVLFIVEGITDEVSLALGFSELMNSDEVRFAITRGDVTTKPSIRVDNIANEITRIICAKEGTK